MRPRVSVVMSVRNGLPYLPEAVHSILQQTLQDFEFIILDNASKDGSPEWVATLGDARIRLVRNEADLGLSGSLNRGFALAQGEYIARMDADDISMPERLAVQVAFMEGHPDVAVCGGEVEIFDCQGTQLWGVPHGQDAMLATLLFGVPIIHPAAMYRGKVWRDLALQYDESLQITQDYDMWRQVGFVHGLRLDNVPQCVLRYRLQGQNLSSLAMERRTNEERVLCRKLLRDVLGEEATEECLDSCMLGRQGCFSNIQELHRYFEWLRQFKRSVLGKNNFALAAVEECFCRHWYNLCWNTSISSLVILGVTSLARVSVIDIYFIRVVGAVIAKRGIGKVKRLFSIDQ